MTPTRPRRRERSRRRAAPRGRGVKDQRRARLLGFAATPSRKDRQMATDQRDVRAATKRRMGIFADVRRRAAARVSRSCGEQSRRSTAFERAGLLPISEASARAAPPRPAPVREAAGDDPWDAAIAAVCAEKGLKPRGGLAYAPGVSPGPGGHLRARRGPRRRARFLGALSSSRSAPKPDSSLAPSRRCKQVRAARRSRLASRRPTRTAHRRMTARRHGIQSSLKSTKRLA